MSNNGETNPKIILFVGSIIVIVVGICLLTLGMGSPSVVAICAAGVSIVLSLFAQYQNNININKQLNRADERLEKQMENADYRINKQLNAQKKNLKKQLDVQKENLKEQLIYDNKQKVLLEIYNELYLHNIQKEMEHNIFESGMLDFAPGDDNKIKSDELTKFIDKIYIYLYLKEIRNDIYRYYYINNDIKVIITEYINTIEKETFKFSRVDKNSFNEVMANFIKDLKSNIGIAPRRPYESQYKNNIDEQKKITFYGSVNIKIKQISRTNDKNNPNFMLCKLLNDVFLQENMVKRYIETMYINIEKEIGVKMTNNMI
ncbi:MAG: hypothetical protein LBM96_00125 [Methanobrevibacter sp.]|jgi:hypothetical protein|nr:hypothetical protein [Candidatus Methanoflexus mossambicus]